MNLLTPDGVPKLVPECTYPLTGVGCVSRVCTDLAVFLIGDGGVAVRDLFGCTFDELVDLLEVPLLDWTREGDP
jgi:3-oxoadipate CoA-transferase beta subunit